MKARKFFKKLGCLIPPVHARITRMKKRRRHDRSESKSSTSPESGFLIAEDGCPGTASPSVHSPRAAGDLVLEWALDTDRGSSSVALPSPPPSACKSSGVHVIVGTVAEENSVVEAAAKSEDSKAVVQSLIVTEAAVVVSSSDAVSESANGDPERCNEVDVRRNERTLRHRYASEAAGDSDQESAEDFYYSAESSFAGGVATLIRRRYRETDSENSGIFREVDMIGTPSSAESSPAQRKKSAEVSIAGGVAAQSRRRYKETDSENSGSLGEEGMIGTPSSADSSPAQRKVSMTSTTAVVTVTPPVTSICLKSDQAPTVVSGIQSPNTAEVEAVVEQIVEELTIGNSSLPNPVIYSSQSSQNISEDLRRSQSVKLQRSQACEQLLKDFLASLEGRDKDRVDQRQLSKDVQARMLSLRRWVGDYKGEVWSKNGRDIFVVSVKALHVLKSEGRRIHVYTALRHHPALLLRLHKLLPPNEYFPAVPLAEPDFDSWSDALKVGLPDDEYARKELKELASQASAMAPVSDEVMDRAVALLDPYRNMFLILLFSIFLPPEDVGRYWKREVCPTNGKLLWLLQKSPDNFENFLRDRFVRDVLLV